MDGAAAATRAGGGPLVDEAMKKAAVVWLAVPDRPRPYPVWCVWIDGALYVVSGAGEQPAPGLTEADTAVVTARGDHGGRIVSWPAAVSRVTPADEDWAAIASQVAGKRLNSSGTAEQTVARWAAECVLARLAPSGTPTEAGRTLPDVSLAAPPPQSPATSPTRRPFRLHRVGRPPA